MGVVGEEGILGSGIPPHHHTDASWWGDYVLVPLLERAADAVMERQHMMASPGDALYTVETFRTAFAGVCGGGEDDPLRETDVKVLVRYLERDRGVLVADKEVRYSYLLPCYLTLQSFSV